MHMDLLPDLSTLRRSRSLMLSIGRHYQRKSGRFYAVLNIAEVNSAVTGSLNTSAHFSQLKAVKIIDILESRGACCWFGELSKRSEKEYNYVSENDKLDFITESHDWLPFSLVSLPIMLSFCGSCDWIDVYSNVVTVVDVEVIRILAGQVIGFAAMAATSRQWLQSWQVLCGAPAFADLSLAASQHTGVIGRFSVLVGQAISHGQYLMSIYIGRWEVFYDAC
ncbi:hypothetical protein Tco_0585697 [Tanacetum coccineum]